MDTNINQENTAAIPLNRGGWKRRLEALVPFVIVCATIIVYAMGLGGGGAVEDMNDRIYAEVTDATGVDAGSLDRGERSRIYLESSVQNTKGGYEMFWATSCSSASVRVAGLDPATMEKLQPTIDGLKSTYGKADYLAIDRVYGQQAYSVCMLYDVELDETQKHALSILRSHNRDFSCLTPLRRVCSVVSKDAW